MDTFRSLVWFYPWNLAAFLFQVRTIGSSRCCCRQLSPGSSYYDGMDFEKVLLTAGRGLGGWDAVVWEFVV
ncbi:hypothetical protein K505DRAFT_330439, partial [Melanomma pulvis-pyrius CBS 109.77]